MSKALPESFGTLLSAALPAAEVSSLLDALHGPAPVSIRVNRQKSGNAFPKVPHEAVPWCPDGFYLSERPLFAADPAFHAGAYYVQEASSMFCGEVVRKLLHGREDGALVLDLCAAPGGKSTHIASVLRQGDLLVANEVIGSRNAILQENLIKWGHANHVVTRADASLFGKGKVSFDVVVADMPCSGEGMFRKDPDSISEWSVQHVNLCADRQMRIAADLWPALKPGGYLIYSTCTYNRHENEDNIRRICKDLGAELTALSLPGTTGWLESEPGMYRALPHRLAGEGFFIAVMQKTGGHTLQPGKIKALSGATTKAAGRWPDSLDVYQDKENLFGVLQSSMTLFGNTLPGLPGVQSAGIPAGKLIRDQFKPDAALALVCGMENTEWPVLSLNEEIALRFLRRDPLPNPQKLAGFHLADFRGMGLGWLNGNRHQWNNLWPMEWRLRMEVKTATNVL